MYKKVILVMALASSNLFASETQTISSNFAVCSNGVCFSDPKIDDRGCIVVGYTENGNAPKNVSEPVCPTPDGYPREGTGYYKVENVLRALTKTQNHGYSESQVTSLMAGSGSIKALMSGFEPCENRKEKEIVSTIYKGSVILLKAIQVCIEMGLQGPSGMVKHPVSIYDLEFLKDGQKLYHLVSNDIRPESFTEINYIDADRISRDLTVSEGDAEKRTKALTFFFEEFKRELDAHQLQKLSQKFLEKIR